MRLTYIYHSGFAIEGENFTIIIDYYRDSDGENDGIVHDSLLHRAGKLYVLSTHSHSDHFNPEILKWKQHRWINLKCDRGRVILINMDHVIVQIIHSRDGRMTYKKIHKNAGNCDKKCCQRSKTPLKRHFCKEGAQRRFFLCVSHKNPFLI